MAIHLGSQCNLGNNRMQLGNQGHTIRQLLPMIWATNARVIWETITIAMYQVQPLPYIWVKTPLHVTLAITVIRLGNHMSIIWAAIASY